MPFSIQVDETKTAKVYGRELKISPKHSREICKAINGKWVDDAINYLERVMDGREAVPFRRYKKKIGHKKLFKWHVGRYPKKASKEFVKLLKEAKANAEYKGLDVTKLKIIHASSYKGRVFPAYKPRAFGRATPYLHVTTNIELIVEER